VILPFLVFWVLIIWSLYDGDLYPSQAAWFIGIWVICLVGLLVFDLQPILFVVPTVLLDIVLIVKVFGGDLKIR
jgi:hypothetical protein